jgi:cation diffusion facilitator CzcD-associated flavoprotein CzcO
MGKTYLEVNPEARLLMLDGSSTLGGTWAKDRLYTDLRTNNLEGGYEFSDFPMDPRGRYGLKHDQHIPGTVMYQYLHDFADHFDLTRRTQLLCRAHDVERLPDDTWLVRYTSPEGERQLHTRKLVIATGLTTRPFVPYFEGQESFARPIAHVKEQAAHDKLLIDAKDVVVLNATKSAYDVAHACAKRGIPVHFIVRKSGHGPVWMSTGRVTPLKKRIEDVGCVRFISWLSPSIWSDAEGYGLLRRFLQGTWLGRIIVTAIWSIINADVVKLSKYDEHPETSKLKPRGDIVWYACTLGIWNYDDDFLEYVRNGTIKVYEDDISRLSPSTVHLASGTSIKTDALICSTGWDHRPSMTFHPPGVAAELGLPTSDPSQSPITPSLIARATASITQALPWLTQNRPSINKNYRPLPKLDPTTKQPVKDDRDQMYRLYRFLAPPTHVSPSKPSPSIAFLGFVWAIPTIMMGQVAALWITAYFGGKLPQQQRSQPSLSLSKPEHRPSSGNESSPLLPPSPPPPKSDATKNPITPSTSPSQERILWETALHTQFAAMRYPGGYGGRFPDLTFEAVPYVDMLMGDLGLEKKRKKGSWWPGSKAWRETWWHYGVADYRGVVGEWVRKEGEKGRGRGAP